MSNSRTRGKLYVVATPIGNFGDLSPRAAETLGRVELVAAEDTRRTGRLLSHFGVEARILACHDHNETAVTKQLLAVLEAGGDVAVVSDAGTPLISDPGWHVVRAAHAAGIAVVAIPGPSAVTAALSIAGLATDRFCFEGFPARKPAQRRAQLEALAREPRTLVFFESVHRVGPTLEALRDAFGAQRPAVLCRELTKLHESAVTGTLGKLASEVGGAVPLRGEFVIVVAGAEAVPAEEEEIRRVYALLAESLDTSTARRLCSQITGASRNRVYELTRGQGDD